MGSTLRSPGATPLGTASLLGWVAAGALFGAPGSPAAPLVAQEIRPTSPVTILGTPAWIGVSFEILGSGDGAAGGAARITDVAPGSPAAAAGLRIGDLLVSVNGRVWATEIQSVARTLRPGDPLTLLLEREGERREVRLRAAPRPAEMLAPPTWTMTLQADSVAYHLLQAMDSLRVRLGADGTLRIRLGELHAMRDSLLRGVDRERRSTRVWAPSPSPVPPQPDREVHVFRPLAPFLLGESRAAGAEVVELRPELAYYFQVQGGVLVVDVPPGTPAYRAGIQPGDVLTHLGGAELRSIADLRRGLARAGSEVSVTLVRKGRAVQVTVGS